MASMVPYRSVFGIRPFNTSLLDAFDDMMDLASAPASRAFPMDVEDKGDGYEVKAYLAGVNKDEIDVELNEGRLSISVNVEDKEENEGKNYLQREFSAFSATRGSTSRMRRTRASPLVSPTACSPSPCRRSSRRRTSRRFRSTNDVF